MVSLSDLVCLTLCSDRKSVYPVPLDPKMFSSRRRRVFGGIKLIFVAFLVYSLWSFYHDKLLWLKVGLTANL